MERDRDPLPFGGLVVVVVVVAEVGVRDDADGLAERLEDAATWRQRTQRHTNSK